MPEWTAEQAREMAARGGRASAIRKRAARAKDPLGEIRTSLETDALKYLIEMKAAGAGEGAYSGLNPKDRMNANKFLLELVYGRPTARRESADPADEDDQDGFALQVGE